MSTIAEYFISIGIAGLVLVVISVIMIVFSSGKPDYIEESLDRKKAEVTAVISDAEQVLEELNKFSEYIVTQIDFKSDELRNNLRYFEQRIDEITSVKKSVIDAMSQTRPEYHAETGIDPGPGQKAVIMEPEEQRKVVHLDSRYREVLRLANEGLSDAEIARKLQMGKGEIQLVLGLNK